VVVKHGSVCTGKGCIYYKAFYSVVKTGSASYAPNFTVPPDERCFHPKVRPKVDFKDGPGGVNVNVLNVCPKFM